MNTFHKKVNSHLKIIYQNILSDEEITKAFERSNNSIDTLLSFTNHDFRDMYKETSSVIKRIKDISENYPDVQIIPIDALTACRKVLKLKPSLPKLNCVINNFEKSSELIVISDGSIHGSQPFLAFKLQNGSYVYDNFDKIGDKRWRFLFDEYNLPWHLVDKIGIAVNSPSGITEVNNYDKSLNSWKKRIINEF